MRPRLYRAGRFRRADGRNHVTKPRVEALEERWLLSGDAALVQAYGQLPMSFQLNEGQTDPQVAFLSQGSGYSLFLTHTEPVLSLQAPAPTPSATPAAPGAAAEQAATDSVLSMQLVGASAAPQVVGQDQLPGVTNYFIGNDPSQWHTNIPSYAQVEEQGVYPGVDLVYYGNQQQLEYNFTIAPGGDPGVIRMIFTGAESATLDDQGNLVLQTADGPVVEQAPVLYQESDGVRQTDSGQFVLEGNGQVGFAVGSYDQSQPLVIDPILSYSTYLGGSLMDQGDGIAVDSAGNAYVTGHTDSANFPTANPLQATNGGFENAFIAKLNPAGSALLYSTYLGGSGYDVGEGIAVDSAGNAYVTGYTGSTNFPTVNPLQSAYGGGLSVEDAFVAKLNPAGSALVYSTYLGGSRIDQGDGIAVDSAGDAYVTGTTTSTNFPTAGNPLQSADRGGGNAFVAKLNPAGSALVYSTYLGGSRNDGGYGIAVDSAGDAYVTGSAASTNFPTAGNPLQATNGGGPEGDAFVAKLNPAGSALVYSTYLGGSGTDQGNGIAVDSVGDAYVTGYTFSTNFPTANPLQATLGGNGNENTFVAKLNPAGSALVYSTYLGGSGTDQGDNIFDQGNGIAVDSAGNAYVTGSTDSTNFPTVNPLQSALGPNGVENAFVAKLNPAGSALVYSTYLGGDENDVGYGIAVDASGAAYVTGNTDSTNFPTTANALQSALKGSNAFVTKFAPVQTSSMTTVTSTEPANPSVYGQSVTFTATVAANPPGSGFPTGTVQFQIDGTNFGSAVTLVNGSATSGADPSLPVGVHSIEALYSGDVSFTASNSTLTQTVNPAAVSQLIITQEPSTTATAGVAFAMQPVVKEEDQFGNVIATDSTHTVAAFRSTGTSGLQGSQLTVTLVNGVATFSGLFYNTAETMTIGFSTNASGVASATSSNVVVSPAAASQLVITQQPSATAKAGVAFATQPVVQEEDQYGNVITSDSTHTVTAARSTGSSSLQGSNLTVTLTSGVATFSGLSYDTAETMTIGFSTNVGSFTATSSNVIVSAAAASQLAFTSATNSSTAGVNSASITVTLEDPFGNAATRASSVIVTPASSSTGSSKAFETTGGTAQSTYTITAGASSVTFLYFDDLAGTFNITTSSECSTAYRRWLRCNGLKSCSERSSAEVFRPEAGSKPFRAKLG